jgi:UPF0755 protein
MKKLAAGILLVALAVLAGAVGYGWHAVRTPWQGYEGEVVLDIPAGHGSREIVDRLVELGVLEHRYPALVWLYLSAHWGRLQAGEYLFDEPLDVEGVFTRIAEGRVRLYTFTVPEGLRIDQIADRWAESGFGDRDEFLAVAAAALPAVREINPRAASVEGYLFPETYSFPRGTDARSAVGAMIRAFGQTITRLRGEVPPSAWPLDLNDTLILASLIESEVAVDGERELVASVFLNRLDRRMRLECDPTVVYALVQDGSYRGRLLRVDLDFDSPYNTYRYPNLPPGAISNPGYASLLAAIRPEETDYIFFVRTEGGRHAFSRTLEEHNAAVAEYRRLGSPP